MKTKCFIILLYFITEAGSFLNTEGSGIYSLQSICNHSCIPNAEPSFPYGNHCLQLKAVTDINPGDEILISYLDECMLTRSKHSRQKVFSLSDSGDLECYRVFFFNFEFLYRSWLPTIYSLVTV